MGAHLSLAALFQPTPSSGARGFGAGGLEISLGPASRAVGQKIDEPPAEEVAQEAKAEVDPGPEPEPEIAPPPEPVPEVPVVKESIKPPKPIPVQVSKPKPKPHPEKTQNKQTQKKLVKSGDGGTGAITIDGDNSADGGRPGLRADYFAQLQAWLDQYRRYPRWAQRRGQEGTTLLYFAIDRDGNVLDYRIERSSVHSILDREADAVQERAKPLPPMPPQVRQARLELLLPIQFSLH